MIRAICLNPVIDRLYYIEQFAAGAQYKGNLPQVSLGGKGINVAKACLILGEPVIVYAFVGGSNGAYIERELQALHCPARLFPASGETRVTVNIIDNSQKQETEILEEGPCADSTEITALLTQLEADIQPGDMVICSGLPIEGAPADIYVRISALCKRGGARCILDTNGASLRHSLQGNYFLVKPNRSELLELCGSPDLCEPSTLVALAKQFVGKHTSLMLLSLGSEGGILLSENDFYFARVPPVAVRSTIGCGDSAVAGFAVATARGLSLLDAFRLSMACGTANSVSEGISCYTEQQVLEALQKVTVFPMDIKFRPQQVPAL